MDWAGCQAEGLAASTMHGSQKKDCFLLQGAGRPWKARPLGTLEGVEAKNPVADGAGSLARRQDSLWQWSQPPNLTSEDNQERSTGHLPQEAQPREQVRASRDMFS